MMVINGRTYMRRIGDFVLVLMLLLLPVFECVAQEIIVYGAGGVRRGAETFEQHAGQIDVISPQTYGVDSLGNVSGGVPVKLLQEAADAGTHVMPLIMNPGFNQEIIHAVLRKPEAQRRIIEFMVKEGVEKGFWGWQFDFENVHRTYKDRFTSFFESAAEALHAAGLTASVAVVPTNNIAEERGFSRYMQDNWRGNFDMKALAEAGDFISLMTYAQHGGPTAPGPIAGLPWIREMLDYALAQGVPREKISLGLPFYSGYWHPDHFSNGTARVRGREIHFELADSLLSTNNVELAWSDEEGVSYGFWQQFGVFHWIFLENARSLEAKLALYDEYPGLRGVSIWVLNAEDPLVWPLLDAHFGR